ncbi:hypothetical protein [Hyphomonas sp.]|uniref:hypothetical protein n=1 Tax=Hyphomonas sp. TaxID=87 RepID=UPI00329A7402
MIIDRRVLDLLYLLLLPKLYKKKITRQRAWRKHTLWRLEKVFGLLEKQYKNRT